MNVETCVAEDESQPRGLVGAACSGRGQGGVKAPRWACAEPGRGAWHSGARQCPLRPVWPLTPQPGALKHAFPEP